MAIMDARLKNPSTIEALRGHVCLDSEVSEALLVLRDRGGQPFVDALSESRAMARRLDPASTGRHLSQIELERWVEAVLRGPHDETFIDARSRSRHRGWTLFSSGTSILLVGHLRQRLIDVATAMYSDSGPVRASRVADALTRLFDLELTLMLANGEVVEGDEVAPSDIDSRRATLQDGTCEIRDALSVIVTSAFLVSRYIVQLPMSRANVLRHLDRMGTGVDRTKSEIRRLVAADRHGDQMVQ